MQTKPLFAALVVAAFSLPLAATAAGTSKASDSNTASASNSNDGGAEAMFKAMDKDGDGFISREEAKGTPHEAEFDQLDKNHDGKLSREEHAAAPEHVAARSGATPTGSSSSSADTSATKKKSY